MQEMNLAHKYSPLHWKVACLCVNAGDINDDISKSTDYGAIAKAIGDMEKGFVTPPYINTAKIGFSPNMKTNTCTFGLSAINGISHDLAREIIALRPFDSIGDFIERCVETKIVQPSKMYNLIKAGCFDELEPNRVDAMMKFVNYVVPDRTKLTTANIPKMLEYGCIPVEFNKNIMLYNFKKYVFDKKNVSYMINKTNGFYIVPQDALSYYEKELAPYCTEAFDYDENGNLILGSKQFDKIYKELNKDFETWLKSQEALERMNYASKNEVWLKYCSGSISKWEMDSLSFYTDKHELDDMEVEKFYTVENFNSMPRTPEAYMEINPRTGREFKKNKLYLIAGTVVDKKKEKSMVTLNTPYGVVDVKLHKSTYTHFDRKTPDEASWFKRGSKIIVVGYRREEMFIPKIYSNSAFSSSIMKIEQMQDGRIEIRRERAFEDTEDFVM